MARETGRAIYRLKAVHTSDKFPSPSFGLWPLSFRRRMIILTLLYLSYFSAPWNAIALPANLQSPQDFPTNHLESLFIREEDGRFDSRSIYNILWSCLSTIFMCTWIAVHPNIPAPGDSQWRVFRRRVAIMGYVLLLPELVIYWAWRQHKAVRNFVKKTSRKYGLDAGPRILPHHGWVHSSQGRKAGTGAGGQGSRGVIRSRED